MKKILSLLLFISAWASVCSQGYEWKVIGEMKFPVWGAQAVNDPSSKDEKIYVLGGYSYIEQDTVNWIQECYIPTNTWQIVGNMQQPRQNFVANTWKSSVVYFGGNNKFEAIKENLESWTFKPAFSVPQVYDTDSNFARSSSTGYVKGDNLYIIGGDPTDNSPYNNLPFIIEYNLDTKQFGFTFDYTASDKPGNHMSFMIGDDIYIFGGISRQGTLLSSISKFNIKEKNMEKLSTSLPSKRYEGAAVYNSIIKKGFIIGGLDETHKPLSTVWLVTFNEDGSMQVSEDFPQLNYPRKGAMAVNAGRFVAVLGGRDIDNKVVPYVEVLDTINITSSAEKSHIPNSFSLSQNYPNPFNPSTLINYQIAKESYVTLKIYDIMGKEIAVLLNEVKQAGNYNVKISSSDISKPGVSSGVYFYRLTAGDFSQTKKMVLIK